MYIATQLGMYAFTKENNNPALLCSRAMRPSSVIGSGKSGWSAGTRSGPGTSYDRGDKRLTTRRKASPPKEASEYLQVRNKTCR